MVLTVLFSQTVLIAVHSLSCLAWCLHEFIFEFYLKEIVPETAFLLSRLSIFKTAQYSLLSPSVNSNPSVSHFRVEARVNEDIDASVGIRHKYSNFDYSEWSARRATQQTDDVNHCDWRSQEHKDTDDD